MAVIRPFRALRPRVDLAEKVAALPYDVYSRKEARDKVSRDPYTFLKIDRPETQFDVACDMYDPAVYRKADELLQHMEKEGAFIQDERACYYIYELMMCGRSQTGLVACSAVDDYLNGVVKKHENTRREKEEDRVRHVDICSAQTGPIFLAYRSQAEIKQIVREEKKKAPICSFTAEDGVRHSVWVIEDVVHMETLTKLFGRMEHTYIADGHHRAASAVRVSLKRREEYPSYTGKEEFNFFLSVLFPDDELKIMDYNRVLKDLNGYTEEEILSKFKKVCKVEAVCDGTYHPKAKGEMGFYLAGKWYRLQMKSESCKSDPVGALDVAFLQRELLEPIFGIKDIKTDSRIDFVGGIRGLDELERRCETDSVCAFAMYPTSMEELFAVADADLLMPPKSTWFEPKLRSGLFIHKIER